VEILIGTSALEPRSYLVTVSEHLERLGHEVLVFAAEPLPSPPELRVVGVARDLPLAPDAIYSQDAEAALLLADLYPLTPQLFVAHGDREDVWLPPQLAGVVARVVVLDDRTAERARAAALPHELLRLRRPVDLDRHAHRGELPERLRRARLALDGLSDYRRGLVQRALSEARIEADEDGELAIGRGQAIVDALADGLAAYVYGDQGGDGWVTPQRYQRVEADGFSGRAGPWATTFEQLRDDLERYDPAMGPANRSLAGAHDARVHAQQLTEALQALAPRRDPVAAPLRELARVVRLEAASSRHADELAAAAAAARARAADAERQAANARARADELAAKIAELEQELADARNRLEELEGQRGRGVRALLGREGKVPSSE
jgi:chaperonin cofactor prefoldin